MSIVWSNGRFVESLTLDPAEKSPFHHHIIHKSRGNEKHHVFKVLVRIRREVTEEFKFLIRVLVGHVSLHRLVLPHPRKPSRPRPE